jgi:hypothetical protein
MPGMRRVVLPKENKKDLTELPDHVRESTELIFAECIEDALAAAIPQLAASIACGELLIDLGGGALGRTSRPVEPLGSVDILVAKLTRVSPVLLRS